MDEIGVTGVLVSNYGVVIACVGAVLAALVAGIGSALGTGKAGQAAAGAVSENPELFSRVLVLQLLPGTQGLYGLVVAFVTMTSAVANPSMSLAKGLAYFAACMPIIIVGFLSALEQMKASVASIHLVTKRPDQFGRAIIFPAIVETYAILALLISFLSVTWVTGMPI